MRTATTTNVTLIGITCLAVVGCIKGPMWRTGYASPWARQRWADEERIAQSIYSRRDEMSAMVESANRGTDEDRRRAAEHLGQIAANDSVLLVRQEAVQLLGRIDHDAARMVLQMAAQDARTEIRMAVVFACGEGNNPEKLKILQGIIGSDADIDVRLAATRALENYQGPEAVRALALALDDSDPALQLRAIESLQVVTGEKLGTDVRAWQAYARNATESIEPESPEQIADEKSDDSTLLR